MAGATQRVAEIGSAAVLPHDGIVDRLASRAIPHNGGLALICDAEAGDVIGGKRRLGDRLAHRLDRRRPDLFRVMLDPAGRGIDLAQLLLRAGERTQIRIERDRAS